jgi:hypothetical protein
MAHLRTERLLANLAVLPESDRSAMLSKLETPEFSGLVIDAFWATQRTFFAANVRNRQSELDLPSSIRRRSSASQPQMISGGKQKF